MKNIREEEGKLIIDLRLIEEEGNQHYCLIKNISRLLSKQVRKHDGSLFFCRRCLSHFPNRKKLAIHDLYCSKMFAPNKEKLAIHDLYCSNNEAIRLIVMPEVNVKGIIPYIKFKNYNRFMRVPFVIYVEFESLTDPIDTCELSSDKSFTKQYQKQKPRRFCFHIGLLR